MQIKLRKVISTVLTLMLIFGLFVGMPGAVYAADTTITGGLNGEVSMEVHDDGRFGVFISDYNPTQQYYYKYSYGSIWHIGGQKYYTNYLEGGTHLGTGTLTRNGNTATVKWVRDGLVFETSYTMMENSRTVQQSWSLTNNTGAPITGARLIAGGDTYFAGSDHGYSGWDASQGVYVYRDEGSGLMAFTPITKPVSSKFTGYYSTGSSRAVAGDLGNSINTGETDQSYYLQWDYDPIQPGAKQTIYAMQSFASAGEIAVTASNPEDVVQGGTTERVFTITNVTSQQVTVGLTVTSEDGDDVSLGASEVTIEPGASANVTATISVPHNAETGEHTIVLYVTIPERVINYSAPFYVVPDEGSLIDVEHVYNLNGSQVGTAAGKFAVYDEGSTPFTNGLLRTVYNGNTYSVRDIKVITYGYVVKEQVEYTVVPWTWDGVYCEQESYTGTALEGILMDQAYFEQSHPMEGYVIDYVEPDGELLSKDAENVFNVYYKLAEEEPEEAAPAVLMIEEPASEEPVIEEPASEEPVLEDQESDFDPGKLTASLDSDIQSLLEEIELDEESGPTVEPPELKIIDSEIFEVGETKEFSDNYQYEIIVTYDYNEPIKSGGPNRGSRTTGTVVEDPVVPLTDAPILDPVQAVIAEPDVPLADVPQTGAVVGFSLAAICGLAGLGTTLLGGRVFMGRRRMK